MIDHVSAYTTHYDDAKRFYSAVLAPLGSKLQHEMTATWDPEFPARRMCAFGPERPIFWVIEVREAASPRHTAFSAASRAQVDAFHRAALATGARDNGAPGVRAIYHPSYYGAFVFDPDGNNVEAVCHAPA
ncbi:MAG TPA: VOC family protein [Myxococcota bacterium]|nr:VOC family protein [Myxococcota bacterium]